MQRKTEITKKSSSSGGASSSVKYTTTTVTTWKSSEVKSASSSSTTSSSLTSALKKGFPVIGGGSSSSSATKKSLTRSTDATAVYNPVYPRSYTATSIAAPAAKNLFYSFPKSPPETKYGSSNKLGHSLPVRDPVPTRPPPAIPPANKFSAPVRPPTTTSAIVRQPSTLTSDHVYAQSHAKSKRLVYIMNHFRFNKDYQRTRDGSWEDVKSLNKALGKFNVTIKERHDQTKAELCEMARKQSVKKNYKGFDFVIYIIMTHGSSDKHLAAKDAMYNLERDFIQVVQSNRTWTGVPKVFIIQACRGDLETDATAVSRVPPFAPNDTLKLFATYEGYVSYRTTAGTFFIQDLCKKITEFGHQEEIMTIMRRVTQEVSKIAPTPEQSSTLQKALYLGKIST